MLGANGIVDGALVARLEGKRTLLAVGREPPQVQLLVLALRVERVDDLLALGLQPAALGEAFVRLVGRARNDRPLRLELSLQPRVELRPTLVRAAREDERARRLLGHLHPALELLDGLAGRLGQHDAVGRLVRLDGNHALREERLVLGCRQRDDDRLSRLPMRVQPADECV